jgi:nucleoside-diphosphate-sugar epimerase
MKIFVTGADGFIGSHLAEHLAGQGHDVVALIQFGQRHSWTMGRPRIKAVWGNILEPSFIADEIEDADMVYHLAALGDVPSSIGLPSIYLQNNIIGTFNVIAQCCAIMDNPRFVMMSSSEVYGGSERSLTEVSRLDPKSIYAASKIGAEAVVQASRHMYGLEATIVRAFNTYGPRQATRGVIGSLMGQFVNDDCKEIRLGNIKAERDFTYVGDMVKALGKLTEIDVGDGPLNISTGNTVSIGRLFEFMQQVTGIDKPLVEDPDLRRDGFEVDRLEGDSTGFRKQTGWKPETSLFQGLQETWQWWRER